ncbi:MAG: type 4a pilus biogenesis protein PilO [Armatimonadetes bacterium]|nr:type 4a pilus biogenesis protein PilO [Armatimonadota bacterium]
MRLFDFKDRDRLPAAIVSLVSVATMTFTLLAMLTVPKPTIKGLDAKQRKDEFKIELETRDSENRLKLAREERMSMVWTDPVSQIGPKALDTISRLANLHKLKLVALRPQRTDTVEEMTEIPMLVTVEGPYLAVSQFLNDLEKPETRLAVTLVQFSSMDGSTDSVSMTAGCTAFAVEPKSIPTGAKR